MPSMSGGGGSLPFIVLRHAAVQAVGSGTTPTKMIFDTVADHEGWVPVPVAPITNLLVPYSGYIQIVAHDLDFADAAITISTGVRKFGRELSGGAATRRQGQTVVGAGGTANNQSVLSWVEEIYVPAGETISIIAAQTSGSSLNLAVNDVMFKYTRLGTRVLV